MNLSQIIAEALGWNGTGQPLDALATVGSTAAIDAANAAVTDAGSNIGADVASLVG